MSQAIWYTGKDASGNLDLYANNGTSGGTALIVNFGAGLYASVDGTYNGKDIVDVEEMASGSLWLTDGTQAGTVEVASDAFSNIDVLGVFNNQICYTGADALGNIELYANNGTSGGTALIANFGPAFCLGQWHV